MPGWVVQVHPDYVADVAVAPWPRVCGDEASWGAKQRLKVNHSSETSSWLVWVLNHLILVMIWREYDRDYRKWKFLEWNYNIDWETPFFWFAYLVELWKSEAARAADLGRVKSSVERKVLQRSESPDPVLDGGCDRPKIWTFSSTDTTEGSQWHDVIPRTEIFSSWPRHYLFVLVTRNFYSLKTFFLKTDILCFTF